MNKQLLTILKFLFFLGIGAGLIWLSLRNTTEEDMANARTSILNANYLWIFLSIIVSGLSHFFRALRWKMLLEPLGHKVRTSNTFFSVMVGYLANFAIHRMGEVTRCGLMTKYEKVPFTAGFGSVITERALDVICVIIIFFAALGMEFDRIYGIADKFVFSVLSEKTRALLANQMLLILVIIFLVGLAAGLIYFRKKIRGTLSGKAKGFIGGLWAGLLSIKNVKQPVLFIFHTVMIWTMYVLQVYVCFFAFPETAHLSVMVAVVIVVFGSLGVVAAPGGTGAYQLIVITILTSVYLLAYAPSFAFAWSVWVSQFILILVLGLASLLLLAILNKEEKAVS